MKAIETEWKGYRFRSRLEARYAVLFEHLGLNWDYEPQGYELQDGRRYLPDFLLRDLGLFIEVKGTNPSEQTRNLLRDFGLPILLVVKLPEFERPLTGLDGTLFTFCTSLSGGMHYICEAHIMECVKCQEWVLDLRSDDSRLERDRDLVMPADNYSIWEPHCNHGYHADFRTGTAVEAGAEKAKKARFEHGETPNV